MQERAPLVCVHGAGAGRPCRGIHHSVCEGNRLASLSVSAHRCGYVEETTCGLTKNARLNRSLIGSDTALFGRPIGRDDNEWHARMVSFKHGWMQVRHSSTRRNNDDNRGALLNRQAEREEPSHSLVDAHPQAHKALSFETGGGERESLRPRAGAQHNVANTATNESPQESRGEI